MNTTQSVVIHGDADQVYRLASRVESWPEILPHYRSVEVLTPGDRERTVSMSCVRRFGPLLFPCRWRAEQQLLPEERKIRFRHLAGPAKGMEVEWRIEPEEDGVRTSIWHGMDSRIPVIGPMYTDWIVGRVFVTAVAGRTLERIKQIVESER